MHTIPLPAINVWDTLRMVSILSGAVFIGRPKLDGSEIETGLFPIRHSTWYRLLLFETSEFRNSGMTETRHNLRSRTALRFRVLRS
jgi:hypothetical protein